MTLIQRTETSLQNPYVSNQRSLHLPNFLKLNLNYYINKFIENIFHYQSHAFNLNRTFSFIPQHHETL